MMKPFNLEAAKAGKPIVTRDGRPVQFIAYVKDASSFDKLIVLVPQRLNVDYPNSILRFPDSGRYNDNIDNKYDLFMAPVKTKYWANVWRDCGVNMPGIFVGKSFKTEQEMLNNKCSLNGTYKYIKTLFFEIEE